MKYTFIIAPHIEVLEEDDVPRAVFTDRWPATENAESALEWLVEDHYGKKLALGVWEKHIPNEEDKLLSFEGRDVWVARCDGFLPMEE
jgi:hypothetical protein